MIELNDVTYTYPQAETPALADLTLAIPAGQFCAVVGANGAGKSTLCYLLTGFVPHYYKGELRGEVQVAGRNTAETPLAELATVASLVFSNPFNQISGARFTVREEIAFGLENMGVPRTEMLARVEEIMAVTGLEDLGDRSPYALSGGQQQRLALASVLVMRPHVLVLDEPTSQLDPHGKQEVFNVLYRFTQSDEMTVVLVEHELEWIGAYADRVLVLDDGRLVADGAPREVLAAAELQARGVGNTRYTEAARRAREAGLVDGQRPLPVTLEQSVAYFS